MPVWVNAELGIGNRVIHAVNRPQGSSAAADYSTTHSRIGIASPRESFQRPNRSGARGFACAWHAFSTVNGSDVRSLLQRNLGAAVFQLFLDFLCVLFGDVFLDRFGKALNQVLGFLQPQPG